MNILINLWSKIQMDKILSPEGRCDQAQSTQLSGCVGHSLYLINQLALLKDFWYADFFFFLVFLTQSFIKTSTPHFKTACERFYWIPVSITIHFGFKYM